MHKPKLSRSGVPAIPMNEFMSWEDWLGGTARGARDLEREPSQERPSEDTDPRKLECEIAENTLRASA